MFTRTKAPMSMTRRSALPRVALLALALASVTCSDPGSEFGDGMITGTVYLSEPVEGATVTLNRWDDGVIGAEVCRATTDATGSYACASGKYFGIMLVTATGGRTTEQGAALTLPAGSALRAPLIDLEPTQQRTIHLNPATDLIVALGRARFAASQDESFAASVARAHALLRTHLDADPVTVAPKAIDAPTAFDESARVALVLRGLGEYAHTAAVDQGVTVQAVNTRALLDQLVRDAGSAEARLDGNGAEVLSIGPSCPLLAGCSMEQLGCYASCAIYSNSLRSRTGAAILSWLRTPANATGLDKTDVLAWVTAMKDNLEPQLFGTEGVEPFDEVGPAITWASPATAQVFTSGAVAIDVTASDALGVASLEVVVQLATPLTVTDTDPSPERVVASLPLAGLPEGPLVLLAIARDTDGNQTDAPRSIELNLVAGGTISGLAFKARLAGATVTAYRFPNGVRGAAVGSTTTGADGSFVNLAIADGTTGALLLETSGGAYAEDSQPATSVTLDVTETLRTVVPNYADGAAISSVVISPLTTLAEAYLAYLTSADTGGADVTARWTTATSAIEAHFGVANIRDITPSAPAQVDTLAAPDRYGLVLIGLSRLAWAASASGGGDAGAFGPAVNAQTITRTWVRDLGDGCWSGTQGATVLTYGGTTALTEEASRLHLAQAIVSYLGDSARNQTAFTSAADVLPLLDTLATGGATTAPGACPGGRVFTTPGDTFDRTGPVVSWTQLPPSADVRGSFMVAATCTDALDPNPVLSIASPAGTVDQDGDITNHNVRASFDTTALPDGPLAVVVDGLDASGNHSDVPTSTRSFLVDNTAPVVSITAPATNGLFLRPPVTLDWTVVEANLASTTALLDGATPVIPGFQVAAEGTHALAVSVADRAGGTASATRTFTIDNTPPLISSVVTPSGAVVKPPLTITATATDNLMAMGSLGTDISVASSPTPTTTTPGTSGGNRTLAVTYAALADGPLTVRFNIADRGGNAAIEHTVTRTIDGTAPTLTWPMTPIGTDYWTTTATPTLTGTVTDANLASVIVSWPGGSVAATATGGTWTATVPAGANLDLAGKDLTVTAADLAGNTTALTRRLRADVTPPVVGFASTSVRQEDRDIVTFDATMDPTYNVKKYNPTHAHSMLPADTTTLGPATACDASAPSIVKYAYLLDEAPLYGSHVNDSAVGGDNAIRWTVAPSDDGVGLTSTRYRVVNVATSAVLLDWTSLPSTTTTVPLRRVGVTSPSIPLLGTTQGLLRFEVEATDQLNRTTAVSRCWNQRLLAAPIVLDPADQAALPTNTAADIAANKWGLSSLSLASTTVPPPPVSMMLTTVATATAAGAGLFEFPIYNPTNEPVYVSVDLDLPAPIAVGSPLTTATSTQYSYDGRWVYREATTTTNCGAVESDPGPPPLYEPNYGLAGCGIADPTGNVPTRYEDVGENVPAADFTVRAWMTNQTTVSLTELTQCPGCSTTPAASGRVRVTVLVPPRGATTTLPPVKVILMATLRPSSSYRPHGMVASDTPIEFAVGSQRLTGQSLGTATKCVQWSRPPGSSSSGAFQCTRTRYYTRARYLDTISVQGVGSRRMYLSVGIAGASTTNPIPHLPGTAGERVFTPPTAASWDSNEPPPLGL